MKKYQLPIENHNCDDIILARSPTIKEILAMTKDEREEFLGRFQKKLLYHMKMVEELRITMAHAMDVAYDDDEPEEDRVPPIIDDKSNRFAQTNMDDAVRAVLADHAPKDLGIRQIARLIIHEGWGGGHKTAKSIVPSVAAVLSNGKRAGLFTNVARGRWKSLAERLAPKGTNGKP